MAVEPEPRRLPIGALTALIPTTEAFPVVFAEQERVTPVGGIFFRDDKRMVFLGEGSSGSLHAQYIDTPEGFTLASVVEGRGRFLDLGRYHDVIVAQVGIADQSIRAHHSVREMPSVSLRFEYKDPETQGEGVYITDETTILRVFTGELGGIALFEGAGRPEEVALILDREHNGQKVAVAFFMHPRESDLIDSVVGFSEFLRLLNEQFTTQSQIPLQLQVAEALEKDKRRGILVFDSPVRERLYAAIVFANARLAHRTGQENYLKFLREHFPSMGRGLRLFGNPRRNQRMRQVDEAINALIIGGQVQTSVTESSSKVEFSGERIYSELIRALESENARELLNGVFRASPGSYITEEFGLDTRCMRAFVKELLGFIYAAKTPAEFRDIEAILATLRNTPFANVGVVDYEFLYSAEIGSAPQLIFYNNPGDTMSSPSRRLNPDQVGAWILINQLVSLLKENRIDSATRPTKYRPPYIR